MRTFSHTLDRFQIIIRHILPDFLSHRPVAGDFERNIVHPAPGLEKDRNSFFGRKASHKKCIIPGGAFSLSRIGQEKVRLYQDFFTGNTSFNEFSTGEVG
ncbi:MAG: hypothetical protein D6748_06300 [Calditrichaeota bacterium]|nr:MAG: hypothetical protein D6748_06300 [Calditrichota bacterium]